MREQAHAQEEMSVARSEKIQIVNVNLDRLDVRDMETWEMREAILLEKTRALLSFFSGDEPDEILQAVVSQEHFPDSFRQFSVRTWTPREDVLLRTLVKARFSAENHMEQIALCRQLAHARDAEYRNMTRSDAQMRFRMLSSLIRDENRVEEDAAHDLEPHVTRVIGERIAYLKNTYADVAYETFAAAITKDTPSSRVSPSYYSDFPGVCEALAYGSATACILPMENSVDGKLLRFYSLLSKYDLRIAMACNIVAEDSETTTKYVLLRRSVMMPPAAEKDDKKDLYMECRVLLEDHMTLDRVLTAAAFYGLSLTRVDSAPSSYAGGEFTYDLILRAPRSGDLVSMLVYLYLLVPQFTLLGIYQILV